MQVTLKGIILGAVGTIATTVLGKIVESVFDVSLFSPAIRTLWGWIQGLGGWLGSDVAFPVWLILLLCLGCLLSLVFIGLFVYANCFENVEEAPRGTRLSPDQLTAFLAISKAIQNGHMLTGDDVRRQTGLSRIATDAALDRLYGLGLIESRIGDYNQQYAGLTHTGRAYYLEIETLQGGVLP